MPDWLPRRIRESVIGDDRELPGPWGPRRVVYAESSGTGPVTTRLREEARQLVREAVGGGDEHVVIFTGSGSTGAVDKLMRILLDHLKQELLNNPFLEMADLEDDEEEEEGAEAEAVVQDPTPSARDSNPQPPPMPGARRGKRAPVPEGNN